MKKNLKKHLSSFVVMTLVSCTTSVPTNQSETTKEVAENNEKTNVVSILQELSEVPKNTNVLKVSDNGAEIKLNMIFADTSNFKIKVNSSGVVEKKLTDVAKVDVYLIQLTAPPTAGSDPLGVANANVVKAFTNVAKTDTGTGFNLIFKGVPTNTATNQYYVGVVVKDTLGNVISKAPAIPWTGNTLATASNMAITSTGVGVNATLVVSTATALTLGLPLADAVGVKVSANIGITNGVTPIISNTLYFNPDIFVIAGNTAGVAPSTVNQLATSVKLNKPSEVAIDTAGNVYIADNFNHLIEKIDTAGNIKVIAGNSFTTGVIPDTSGTQNATSVSLNGPFGVALDSSGNVYIADANNQLVEKIDTAGNIKVIAGNSFTTGVIPDTSGTQIATSVSLNFPVNVTLDTVGNVYIADNSNHLIEKIDTTGKIKIIAGNSFTTGVKPDTSGAQIATSVSLNFPWGIASDSTGNVYITDRNNNLIEKIDTAGKIKVIAGNSFTTGVKPDTSGTQIATSVSLNFPYGVAVDNSGNVYISDKGNFLTEKIDTTGKIKVIAGNSFTTGVIPSTVAQIATSVSLNVPWGIAVDSSGNVFIADRNNNLIEKITGL